MTACFTEVPGYEGYAIDQDGQPFTKWSEHRLVSDRVLGSVLRPCKTYIDSEGYVSLKIRPTGTINVIDKRLHTLILLTIFGPCPGKGFEGRHLDDNKSNNHPSNLRWGTRKQNAEDMARNGKSTKGERNPTAVITDEQVVQARELAMNGMDGAAIAVKLQAPYAAISIMLQRKTWKHINSPAGWDTFTMPNQPKPEVLLRPISETYFLGTDCEIYRYHKRSRKFKSTKPYRDGAVAIREPGQRKRSVYLRDLYLDIWSDFS